MHFNKIKKGLGEVFNAFSFDFKGHGKFASDVAFSIELFTENVVDFMLENEIGSINKFGYNTSLLIQRIQAKNHLMKDCLLGLSQ
ncbi:MAG: hypothetical protein JXQ87_00920 [Bacteroidia bacterium]